MAAPAYAEDLTDITLAESTTGWSALGGGASGLGTGADFSMQGTLCVDKQITSAEKGQVYDNGATITPGADTHFFVWMFLATPGLTDTRQNRGLAVIAGTSTSAYTAFHVEGNDTYGAVGRVGKCYTIRYNNTSNTSHPYRTLTGSPGANPQYFGATANITASVKGANLGVDAIRYGTGAYLTAGELISAGDGSDNPCTFSGYAAQNDAVSNRWGILTSLGGGNYELQGRFVVGQNNAKTATLARFKDSNKNIIFVDTFHSNSDFTQVILDHASTRVEWTNINLTALGTGNPGMLVVNSANPTFVDVGGTCTNIGTTTLRSNTTSTGRTWRGCDQVVLNGATLVDPVFDKSTAASAVLAATPAGAALISGATFLSDGTGHALEITGTAADFSLSGTSFTGYAGTDGSTGNEAIYVNIASGSMTISITGGGDTPTIRTAGATVVVQNAVTVTVTVKDAATLSPIENARVLLEKVSDGTDILPPSSLTNASGVVTTSYAYTGDTAVTGTARRASSGLGTLYKPGSISGTITTNGFDVTILLNSDE